MVNSLLLRTIREDVYRIGENAAIVRRTVKRALWKFMVWKEDEPLSDDLVLDLIDHMDSQNEFRASKGFKTLAGAVEAVLAFLKNVRRIS
jgi:hypothetical protein